MMNEKQKQYLRKLNEKLMEALKATVPVNVYQDNVAEDEEENFHYFIFETLGFTKSENKGSLRQGVLVRYYSEGRDDLDELSLDIISTMEANKHIFVSSEKIGIQKGETDSYIDELTFTFIRLVKYGC
ncbi:MAG: hypothetical protein ACI35R_13070 [Bacillus sp. (in: firmicutes)]